MNIVIVPTVTTSRSLRSMATNDPICRECRNDRKEEYKDSDGNGKQIEGGARKDRVSLSSKANVLFRRLDEPLVNILQGGIQEHKPVGGDTGEEVDECDMEVSSKDGGEAVEGTNNQGNRPRKEGNCGNGTRTGSQDSSHDVRDSAGGAESVFSKW
jgi:hypothetical protein